MWKIGRHKALRDTHTDTERTNAQTHKQSIRIKDRLSGGK